MTSETNISNGVRREITAVPTLSAKNKRIKSKPNSSVSDHAHSLCEFGLSDRSLKELEELPLKIQNWSRRLRSLQQYPALRTTFGKNNQQRLKNMEWLAGFYQRPLIEPKGFALYAYPHHASRQAATLYRSAKKHHKRLDQKLAQHGQYIDIDALPEFSHTLEILDIVTGAHKTMPFSGKRRDAQETISNAILERCSLKNPELLNKLRALRSVFSEMSEFRSSAVYKEFLGPSFLGYNTNWADMKDFIKYSQAISYSCADPNLGRQLIQNWPSHQKDFKAAGQKTASVIKEMHKLAKLTGLILQTRTKNPRLSTILKNAAIAESNIREHLNFLSSEVNDNTLTPKTIIQMNLG